MPYDAVATNKLYECPNFEAYIKAKHVFLGEKLEGYAALAERVKKAKDAEDHEEIRAAVQEQWERLLDAFGLENLREKIDTFKHFGLNVASNNSETVLKLDDLLGYFEDFYFLYHNELPAYRLNSEQKADLVTSLEDAITKAQVCDTGRATRFQDIVQRLRQDPTSWVLVELHKQRITNLQLIAEEYNAEYKVSDGLSPHTIHFMQDLAYKEEKLGFEASKLKDIHADLVDKPCATSYFKTQAPLKFTTYEQNAIDNLTNHAMILFIEALKKHKDEASIFAWQTRPISLSCVDNSPQENLSIEQIQNPEPKDEFTLFIKYLKETIDKQTIESHMNLLGAYNDDYTEFSFKSKRDLQLGLRKIIEIKLKNEGFFRRIDAITEDNIHTCSFRLLPEVSPQNLWSMIETIKNISNEELPGILQEKSFGLLIQTCPSVLLNRLIDNPSLFQALPKEIQYSPTGIECLITALEPCLLDESDKSNQEKAIRLLKTVVGLHPWLIKLLPEKFFYEPVVNFLFDMDGEPLSSFHRLHDALPTMSLWRLYSTNSAKELYCGLERLKNVDVLLSLPFISTKRLISLARNLSPLELYHINEARLIKQMPSLPHCNQDLLRQFKDTFNQQIWLQKGFLYIKNDCRSSSNKNLDYLSPEFRVSIARNYLLESDSWFVAFMRYQQELPAYYTAFKSLSELKSQLYISLKAIGALLYSNVVLLTTLISTFLLPFIGYALQNYLTSFIDFLFKQSAPLITLYFGPVLPYIALAVVLLYYVKQSDPWPGFSNGFKLCAFLLGLICLINPVGILWASIAFTLLESGRALIRLSGHLLHRQFDWLEVLATRLYLATLANDLYFLGTAILVLPKVLQQIFNMPRLLFYALAPWFTRIVATIISVEKTPVGDEALSIAVEESILRLSLMDDSTALQKSVLLENLWEKILADEDPTLTLTQKLQKPYRLSTEEKKEEPLSFQEVAATKRIKGQNFIPKSPDTRFAFFKWGGSTSTVSELNKHMQLRPA